jgi:hypothetical protein
MLVSSANGGVEDGGGARRAHSRLKPRHHFEFPIARLAIVQAQDIERRAGTHPNVGRDAAIQTDEFRRHHPGHQDRLIIEKDCLADYLRTAPEALLPQAVSDYSPGTPFRIVHCCDAQLRAHSQHRKVIGRDDVRQDRLVLTVPGKHGRCPVVGHQRRQIRRGFHHVQVVQPAVQQPTAVVGVGRDCQEFPWPINGEGAQQDRVGNAEDSGGEADP